MRRYLLVLTFLNVNTCPPLWSTLSESFGAARRYLWCGVLISTVLLLANMYGLPFANDALAIVSFTFTGCCFKCLTKGC